jgi:hypothetical protein
VSALKAKYGPAIFRMNHNITPASEAYAGTPGRTVHFCAVPSASARFSVDGHTSQRPSSLHVAITPPVAAMAPTLLAKPMAAASRHLADLPALPH